MSLDNSPGIPQGIKNLRLHHPYSHHRCGPPRDHKYPLKRPSMDFAPGVQPSSNSSSSSSSSSPSFLPRPFPPSNLADVPVEYIVDQLRNLASLYWNKPETADCTIIIPVPNYRGRASPPSGSPLHPPSDVSSSESLRAEHDPTGSGRRATEPVIQPVPRITLKLHVDYLSAQSTFLRGLFSGASPLDLINTTVPSSSSSSPESPRRASAPFHVPANRLPRLLPSPPSHPVLFLPIPDPSSIHLLFHWMYFGRTNHIEDCLNRGIVHWEGLARNVEYLGLPTEIKIFLGRWYGNWILPARNLHNCDSYDDDSDDEDLDDEDDDDDDDDGYSTQSSRDDDSDMEAIEDFERGRTRTIRPLSGVTCGPPYRACTA
ncbi:hypothetical protein SERLA73DRAFT_186744 [Serpula lacrymans var. lacrymans S7.3]|uniref:BTB domain-containing protein n=1 Tax=Serpula lacrymans var. lacrymans (strain S7.3) TaxID=936435 RepID=F8Q7U2_SERL3|nr:hypothetical protein SERLA73DRAFT_186744 [Serpula lacrymans var. lacrymans S7.3]